MRLGSAGADRFHHYDRALFAERAGIDLLHVPYRGGRQWLERPPDR